MDFTDKVILITGAAGALSEGLVRKAASLGARLALVDRSPDRLAELYSNLPDALLIPNVELSEVDSVQHMTDKVMAEHGRIDVLFNVAGGWQGGKPVHETPPDVWDSAMNGNAKSVFVVCRAVIPHMLAQGGGKIVSVAAKAGLLGTANAAVQSASKGAVIRLTEAMSAELKDQGINVNCVIPTMIDTPANRASTPKADFSKWVTPEQMAEVMLFLASEEGSPIHGVAIPVYGRM